MTAVSRGSRGSRGWLSKKEKERKHSWTQQQCGDWGGMRWRGAGGYREINGDRRRRNTVHRWCVVELCTQNLYNIVNQCHVTKFDKKEKKECLDNLTRTRRHHSWSQWRPESCNVQGLRAGNRVEVSTWRLTMNCAGFIFISKEAFSYISYCWLLWGPFYFVFGVACRGRWRWGQGPSNPAPDTPWHHVVQARFEPWSDSKAQADPMVSRKTFLNVTEDLFCFVFVFHSK